MSIPYIFDVKRSSLDDGPGIRTVVFLKGCLLHCSWCHNPESINLAPEVMCYPERCIGCGACIQVCPVNAISFVNGVQIDRECCEQCGKCATECYALALRQVGKQYSVEELVSLLLRDRMFYEQSGGGVTFSGGEPLLHIDYVAEVLAQLKAAGVHTAIETSGYFEFGQFERRILPYLDLVMYDLKLYDDKQHILHTGRSNERILHNFVALSHSSGVKVIPRIPLIPGITDSEDNLQTIAAFVQLCGYTSMVQLPYNVGGVLKRERLGQASKVS